MDLQRGDIVLIKASILNEPRNSIGIVYEEYKIGNDKGVSIITANRIDLGGFSTSESIQYLEKIAHIESFDYEFKNVNELSHNKYIESILIALKNNEAFLKRKHKINKLMLID